MVDCRHTPPNFDNRIKFSFLCYGKCLKVGRGGNIGVLSPLLPLPHYWEYCLCLYFLLLYFMIKIPIHKFAFFIPTRARDGPSYIVRFLINSSPKLSISIQLYQSISIKNPQKNYEVGRWFQGKGNQIKGWLLIRE